MLLRHDSSKTPKSREKNDVRRHFDYCGITTTEYRWTTKFIIYYKNTIQYLMLLNPSRLRLSFWQRPLSICLFPELECKIGKNIMSSKFILPTSDILYSVFPFVILSFKFFVSKLRGCLHGYK
jgi:hypothetical protein